MQHTVAADIAVDIRSLADNYSADTAAAAADNSVEEPADIAVADIRSRWADNYSAADSSAAADNSVTAADRMLSEHPTASHRIHACVSAPLWCIQSGRSAPDRSLS